MRFRLLPSGTMTGTIAGTIVGGFLLSACNLAKDNQELNLSSAHLSSDALPGHAVVRDDDPYRALDPWETGYDPYSFADIKPGTRPDIATDEAGLWMLTDRMTEQLHTAGNRVRDEELNKYISDLVCDLSGPYCADTRTFIIRVPLFNATMMPNGTMQVWTGLLLRVHNEAQLAAVLGHETGHFIRRHSLQRKRDITAKTNALAFLGIASAAAGVPQVSDIAGMVAAGTIQAFSRDHEREADIIGLSLLAEAGLDPDEGAKLWENLVRETDAQEDRQRGNYFLSTHPAGEERIATLKTLSGKLHEKMAGTGYDTGRSRYLSVISKHRGSFLEDEVRRNTFETTQELLNILYEEGHNRAEIRYFQGEIHRRRGEENDFETALEHYALAESEGTPPAELYRARGLVNRRLGDTGAAVVDLERYLSLVPESPERALIRAMINDMEQG